MALFIVTGMLLGACAPIFTTPTPPVEAPAPRATELATPAQAPASNTNAAVEAAVQALAKLLSVDPSAITVVKIEPTEWPDACLDLPEKGEMCTQVLTPGYLVVLEAKDVRYEYRTNATGSKVRLGGKAEASQPAAAPASTDVVIVWHREGGFAGYCDDLTIYATGLVSASSCKGNQPTTLGTVQMIPAQLEQLTAWIKGLKSFAISHTDKAKADAMTVRLTFTGAGAAEASNADKQAIQDFAAGLFAGFKR
jgi:hypothetical protein